MTNDAVFALGRRVLDRLGLQDWRCELYSGGEDRNGGHCDHSTKRILLNPAYFYNDKFTWETVLHEIAHVLTPFWSENHGAEFSANFEMLKRTSGPQGEYLEGL
jgi:hypothetical protein